MINIQETSQITRIYLVTNCHGNPNKVYIGKTKVCRKNSHKRTYGKDITYDYIDEVESLDRKIWTPVECFWIEQFRQWGFEIQNPNKKGGGGPEFQTEYQKFKRSKPVIQYSLDGKFIKEWESSNRAGIELNIQPSLITGCCKKRFETTHNFVWRYSWDILDKNFKINKNNKKVIQYNIDGDFIKEWDSATEASKYLNTSIGGISNCCNYKLKTSQGYVWRFKFKPLLLNLSTTKRIISKPIIQYSIEGEFIKEWISAKEAETTIGRINNSQITQCCRNKLKKAYGFKWKYKE